MLTRELPEIRRVVYMMVKVLLDTVVDVITLRYEITVFYDTYNH
jgi:hypothetical protein